MVHTDALQPLFGIQTPTMDHEEVVPLNSSMTVRWIKESTESLTMALDEPGWSSSGLKNRHGGPHSRWHAAITTKISTPGRG